VLLGATPVFVDIDPATCNLNPLRIEERITERTRAIMPVSLYGLPADMDEINAIAWRHGLAVIEDAAQSFGATYGERKSCNLSKIGCTSFFPSKPLGCYGDGGAIFTSDDALAGAMREIRVHGQSRRYVHSRIGVGGRMDTLQCAIVLAKLERFEWELEQRARIAAAYDALLSGKLGLVARPRDRSSAFAQYTVVLDERDQAQAMLHAAGIPTAIHYPVPMHLQPAYAHWCSPDDAPVALNMSARVLSLPMGPYMGLDSVQQVASALLGALGMSIPASARCVPA
jgi:UDP-2-acetamido-2-deoxy-ribo-hexuluronate aminotransferase